MAHLGGAHRMPSISSDAIEPLAGLNNLQKEAIVL
jgi:hypothetical protein